MEATSSDASSTARIASSPSGGMPRTLDHPEPQTTRPDTRAIGGTVLQERHGSELAVPARCVAEFGQRHTYQTLSQRQPTVGSRMESIVLVHSAAS